MYVSGGCWERSSYSSEGSLEADIPLLPLDIAGIQRGLGTAFRMKSTQGKSHKNVREGAKARGSLPRACPTYIQPSGFVR